MKNFSKRIFSLLCALLVLMSVVATAVPIVFATEVETEENSEFLSYTFLADDITLPYADAGLCDGVVNDPDSKHGRAAKLSYEERLATGDSGLYNVMIYPAGSILSLYTCDGKEGKPAGYISSEDLQANAAAGQYMTYKMTGIDLTGATFIYMYNCWGLQIRFTEEQLSALQGKVVNVSVSMKVTGDVTNPANPPAYYVDEIIVAEADPNAVHIHAMSDWRYANEFNHEKVCTAGDGCTEGLTEEHDWGEAEVTREPTAELRGEMTFTCTVCKGTKTKTFAMPGTETTTPADNSAQTQNQLADPVLWIAIGLFAGAIVLIVVAIVLLKRSNKEK